MCGSPMRIVGGVWLKGVWLTCAYSGGRVAERHEGVGPQVLPHEGGQLSRVVGAGGQPCELQTTTKNILLIFFPVSSEQIFMIFFSSVFFRLMPLGIVGAYLRMILNPVN